MFLIANDSLMKTTIQKNVVIINEETWEKFYWEDPHALMKELGKKYKWSHFKVEILNPKYKFYMK